MLGDLLAEWLAVQGSGSIDQFRRAHDWIARSADIMAPTFEAGRWLRDMSALGHIEVDWESGRWSTTPLVVTRLPESDGLALLVGCRTGVTLQAISDLDVEVLQLDQVTQTQGVARPSVVLLQYGGPDDLDAVSKALSAEYVPCAAGQLSQRLTPPQLGEPAAPPSYQNQTLERFNPRSLRWGPADRTGPQQGAYRYEHFGRKHHLFLGRDGWRHADMAAAVFAALREVNASTLRWRPDGNGRDVGSLYVDWGAPLPTLHQRCLVLCSGFTPHFFDRAFTGVYDNVPRSIAGAVASSLGQHLETI
ncbi:hypothetical protein [Geodermatophilus saharensis]|uniref:hypothetical protein n=1 Tax=Geodermatophilus saharensis TaxID=1137994 RepID=UPI000B77BD75|nr:hypothetical protein [Geodermatophilus saharensis]